MNSSKISSLGRLRKALIGLKRNQKIAISVAVDCIGLLACSFAAFWVLGMPLLGSSTALTLSIAAAVAGIGLIWALGLYRSVVRFVGLDLFLSAAGASFGAAVIASGIAIATGASPTPLRWGLAFLAFSTIYVSASRFFASIFLSRAAELHKRERVLIYGAGSAAAQLILSLHASPKFTPVGMVDDDKSLHGKRIKGFNVYPSKNIEATIEKLNIDRVLLAMPSASRRRRRQILKRLSEHPVHVQTVPDVADIVSGKARVDDVSDVKVEDLLGRDPVPPKAELLDASTQGKTVLVTGAGGSIGSELCRQIIARNPELLVLLEMNEASLYAIDRELHKLCGKRGCSTEIVPLLGSVHHEGRVREILSLFDVDTIYHAAAYKHVPIVEHNVFEGIHNNIFGTLHTARAAAESGVDRFVLISTDKAVNPTNVMGATKRMSELILQALNAELPNTTFCMVRFGNVLESSGSVVPLFREQIRAGGPITVTHRDIIRYFMTIPEAAQLVIQAAALAEGGDVFVLDMGKPVKIHDLAKRMVNLMGLTVRDEDNPEGDIDIEFIGLRPAEKLYEELLIGTNATGTEHPRILRADEEFLSYDALREILEQLKAASAALDYDGARRLLLQGVKEYQPDNGIDDLLWRRRSGQRAAAGDDRVVDFPGRPT